MRGSQKQTMAMTMIPAKARIEHRLTLRRQLLAQRQLIVQQLGPTPEVICDYPRSMTIWSSILQRQ